MQVIFLFELSVSWVVLNLVSSWGSSGRTVKTRTPFLPLVTNDTDFLIADSGSSATAADSTRGLWMWLAVCRGHPGPSAPDSDQVGSVLVGSAQEPEGAGVAMIEGVAVLNPSPEPAERSAEHTAPPLACSVLFPGPCSAPSAGGRERRGQLPASATRPRMCLLGEIFQATTGPHPLAVGRTRLSARWLMHSFLRRCAR